MKIKARKGEFYFKALIPVIHGYMGKITNTGYQLSERFYATEEEAKADNELSIWPAEMIDQECVYVPSKEEMEEEF